MPSPDYAGDAFVPLYLGALRRDHPTVARDPALLGWWAILLWEAHRAYPGPAPLPRGLDDETAAQLAGIIDRDGDWFTFHGLARLREYQTTVRTQQSMGGKVRAQLGQRDANGRWVAAGLGAGPAGAGNAGAVNGSPPFRSGSPAGPWAGPAGAGTSTTSPRTDTSRGSPNGDSSTGGAAGPAGAGPAGNVTAARVAGPGVDDPCYAVPAHPPETRQRVSGRGWVCVACERADTRTLRERTGWVPSGQGTSGVDEQ